MRDPASRDRWRSAGLLIYNTFKFPTGEDPNKISVLKKKFEDYVNLRTSTVFERYQFWEGKQQEGEAIDQFIAELKTRARSCKFGDHHNSMIWDRIVFGVRDWKNDSSVNHQILDWKKQQVFVGRAKQVHLK